MIQSSALVIPAGIHAGLKAHLFPGDGCEAAAILLCSRSPGARKRLLAHRLILVPHGDCPIRTPDYISWPGRYLEEAIDRGEGEGFSVVLIHSHPGGMFAFSHVDDESDAVAVRALHAAYEADHGSAIMMPSGAIRARTYRDGIATDLDLVIVPGDDILTYWADRDENQRAPVAFTSGMTAQNSRLSVLVIGASGTGSPTIEQLLRLGFGRVVGVEYDLTEFKNLNRILNTTIADAETEVPKVQVMLRAAESHRGQGVFVPVERSIFDRGAVLAGADCDIILCCVDTLEARYIADLMGSAFLMPIIDMGVVIPTRRASARTVIADVCGRIDYVYPGGSTLADRGVYTPEALETEYLRLNAPDVHREKVKEGYIRGMAEEAPSVISLNMRASAAAVNELLARLYPFRHEHNSGYARTFFSLAAAEEDYTAEGKFKRGDNGELATGAREPLLALPALGA